MHLHDKWQECTKNINVWLFACFTDDNVIKTNLIHMDPQKITYIFNIEK